MKFIFILYTLKVNLIQVLVNSCRTHSISLQFIDSSIFAATTATDPPGDYADAAFIVNNITDIPVI
ncbi:uncharacterized protein PRCAT00002841001 [Priceomyces carsonii]|uniref:uncharacterized protein n=1 Tax=Priceomyces carsonii TaxID=28549 RepID=UPI002ED7C0ED|nr:unnamed protein product [Priceomyces carsonii]